MPAERHACLQTSRPPIFRSSPTKPSRYSIAFTGSLSITLPSLSRGLLCLCQWQGLLLGKGPMDPRGEGRVAAFAPISGKSRGACPGYVSDHVIALKRGGPMRHRICNGRRRRPRRRRIGRSSCLPAPVAQRIEHRGSNAKVASSIDNCGLRRMTHIERSHELLDIAARRCVVMGAMQEDEYVARGAPKKRSHRLRNENGSRKGSRC
jgi:hypothetical protein